MGRSKKVDLSGWMLLVVYQNIELVPVIDGEEDVRRSVPALIR